MIRKSFGRSLSFPIPASVAAAAPKIKGRGSASLPCRFHPFIAQLDDEIHALLTWQRSADPGSPPSAAWIADGITKLERLHSSLDDLLQHPQAQDPLRRRSPWAHRALDDFLRLADAYGSFRSAIVDLGGRQSATHAAIWRGDEARIACCAREQRKADKEAARIAAAVRGAGGRWGQIGIPAEDEIAAVIREALAVTASASAAVFAAVVGMSAAAGVTPAVWGACGSWKGACVMMRLGSMRKREEEDKGAGERWRREAMEKLAALGECIGEVEKGIQRLFKSLVNTRVLLLNILTPSL